MPVNEGDCLFSFNQHTRFSLLQSAHFFSQVDCEKIGSCRSWLVIHVSTYFMLFFPLTRRLCTNGVRNAPMRLVLQTSTQLEVTV